MSIPMSGNNSTESFVVLGKEESYLSSIDPYQSPIEDPALKAFAELNLRSRESQASSSEIVERETSLDKIGDRKSSFGQLSAENEHCDDENEETKEDSQPSTGFNILSSDENVEKAVIDIERRRSLFSSTSRSIETKLTYIDDVFGSMPLASHLKLIDSSTVNLVSLPDDSTSLQANESSKSFGDLNDFIGLNETESDKIDNEQDEEDDDDDYSVIIKNSDLIEIQNEIRQLREDNNRLAVIFESNNQALRKNYSMVKNLQEELEETKRSYTNHRRSSTEIIENLQSENVKMKKQLCHLQEQMNGLGSSVVKYPGIDVEKEIDMHDLVAKIIDKEQEIVKLRYQIEQLRIDDRRTERAMIDSLRDQCISLTKLISESREKCKHLTKENIDLRKYIDTLKRERADLIEKQERGEPTMVLTSHDDAHSTPETHGRHRRRRRFNYVGLERKINSALPALNKGITLKSLRQFGLVGKP